MFTNSWTLICEINSLWKWPVGIYQKCIWFWMRKDLFHSTTVHVPIFVKSSVPVVYCCTIPEADVAGLCGTAWKTFSKYTLDKTTFDIILFLPLFRNLTKISCSNLKIAKTDNRNGGRVWRISFQRLELAPTRTTTFLETIVKRRAAAREMGVCQTITGTPGRRPTQSNSRRTAMVVRQVWNTRMEAANWENIRRYAQNGWDPRGQPRLVVSVVVHKQPLWDSLADYIHISWKGLDTWVSLSPPTSFASQKELIGEILCFLIGILLQILWKVNLTYLSL